MIFKHIISEPPKVAMLFRLLFHLLWTHGSKSIHGVRMVWRYNNETFNRISCQGKYFVQTSTVYTTVCHCAYYLDRSQTSILIIFLFDCWECRWNRESVKWKTWLGRGWRTRKLEEQEKSLEKSEFPISQKMENSHWLKGDQSVITLTTANHDCIQELFSPL